MKFFTIISAILGTSTAASLPATSKHVNVVPQNITENRGIEPGELLRVLQFPANRCPDYKFHFSLTSPGCWTWTFDRTMAIRSADHAPGLDWNKGMPFCFAVLFSLRFLYLHSRPFRIIKSSRLANSKQSGSTRIKTALPSGGKRWQGANATTLAWSAVF